MSPVIDSSYASDVKGLTLLETLISIAVVAIVVAIGIGSYGGWVKNVELGRTADTIISDLKSAQANAMNGQGGLNWGIHFVNGSSQYYEIFSTPTDYSSPLKTITGTVYLQNNIAFSSPSSGNSTNVVFNRISGTISSDTQVSITFDGAMDTVNITTAGNIY
jgi:prepilin-type N-terminal cleavage/methylation domain-containing protein